MEVTQYTYQSPYTSPVQFGRKDASESNEKEKSSVELPAAANETATKAQEFQATQTQETKPKVNANPLDLYA